MQTEVKTPPPDDGRAGDLDAQIRSYLLACDVEGKTERTLQAYQETLGQFARASRDRGLPGNAGSFTAPDVYEFLQWVRDRGVSLGTRHRRYRETRAFFSWCLRMKITSRNPFEGISMRSNPIKGHVLREAVTSSGVDS